MEKIYILRKQKVISGPYTLERIKSRGGLRYNDMIWYEGLADWTPADQVEKLSEYVRRSISGRSLSSNIFDKVFSFLK
jgi:hypothetical protein